MVRCLEYNAIVDNFSISLARSSGEGVLNFFLSDRVPDLLRTTVQTPQTTDPRKIGGMRDFVTKASIFEGKIA
jgi:hypothetical protein